MKEREYDDPLLVQTKYGDILTLSARFPDGSVSKIVGRKSAAPSAVCKCGR